MRLLSCSPLTSSFPIFSCHRLQAESPATRSLNRYQASLTSRGKTSRSHSTLAASMSVQQQFLRSSSAEDEYNQGVHSQATVRVKNSENTNAKVVARASTDRQQKWMSNRGALSCRYTPSRRRPLDGKWCLLAVERALAVGRDHSGGASVVFRTGMV